MIDVLIVGAGPTGLTMALECARYGLSCRIIDQAEGPTTYSKAIAVQARTLETFQRMGIHHRFLEAGTKIVASNIYSGHKQRARVDLTLIDSSFSYVLSLEQSKTEAILVERLKELGVEVEWNTALTSLDQYEARYIVGCDGAHSVVRKLIGCTFEGKTFHDIFSLADVHVEWNKAPHELHVFLETDGIMAAFPLPEKNRYRLIFQLKRLRDKFHPKLADQHGIIDSEEFPPPTIQEIEEHLSQFSGEKVNVSDPRWIANFHINSRLSNKYRKDNVFLCGDAAHIHSPVGGQGMNTGIQDAFNLAWKLAYVIKKGAPESLLDTYEQERHTLGKRLLKGTEKASSMVSLHAPALIFLRNHLLSGLLSLKAVQKEIAAAISELDIELPHKRVPNYSISGEQKDFYELTEGSTDYHLLLFNTDTPPITHPHLRVYHITDDSGSRALLARPDGYTACEDSPPFKNLHDILLSANQV